MEKFDRNCVTNLGRNAIAKLDAGGYSLRLTRVQMGKGTVDASTEIQEFTGLVDGVQYNDINSANTLVSYQTTIAFTVKGSDVIKTFKWSELGIFARLDDGEEFLFAYAYSSNPDTLVEGSKVVDQYVFGIRFENSEKVTVELHVDQTVPLHAATHLGDGVDPIPTVSSERSGLVPVGPDDPTLILVGNNPPRWGNVPLATMTAPGGIPKLNGIERTYFAGNGRWHWSTPFILSDMTLYVDPDNNDHWPKFSTLAKALEYIGDVNISAGATVTVVLADGTHTIEDAIKFDHPQAQQVRIVGASQRQRIAFTEIKEDGDDLILRVESVKGLSVGMSIIIQGEGEFWNHHPGGHTIKHIEYPHVRVSRSLLNQPPWWTECKGLSANLYFYKTKVDCSNSGLFLPDGIGHLSQIAMHGHWVPNLTSSDEPVFNHHGVFTYGKAFFSDLIVSGFVRGITARYQHFDLNFVAAHGCSDGIMVDCNSLLTTSGNLYSNGNIGNGIYLQQANAQIGNAQYYQHGEAVFLKGNWNGILSVGDSHAWMSNILSQFNTVGCTVTERGTIMIGKGGLPCWINENNMFDVYALYGGFFGGSFNGGNLGRTSPSDRTISNDLGYIAVDN